MVAECLHILKDLHLSIRWDAGTFSPRARGERQGCWHLAQLPLQGGSSFTGILHCAAVKIRAVLKRGRRQILTVIGRPFHQLLATHEKLPQMTYLVDAHGHELHGGEPLQRLPAHAVLPQPRGRFWRQAHGGCPASHLLRAPVLR